MATFTTKKLAEKLGMETKELINILFSLEFVKEDERKCLVSFSKFGENVNKETFSFIIWNESLLEDNAFKKAIEPKKEEKEEQVEVKFISATVIAAEKGITPAQVNQILVEIHYLNKLGEGFSSTHSYAKQLLHDKIPYVKWNEKILQDEIFNREVNSIKTSKEEFKKEEVNPENKEASIKEPFKFDRKSFDAALRTQSGHFVRSRAEVIVADWLYNNDVMFAYEKRLPILDEAYSDFFIKKGKVYIEVWGLESSKYLERKAKKIEIYKENGFTLIGLDDKDIENIDDFLPLKLAQIGIMI